MTGTVSSRVRGSSMEVAEHYGGTLNNVARQIGVA